MKKPFTKEHKKYLAGLKRERALVSALRIAILAAILLLWEILTRADVIDPFVASSPSRIAKTLKTLFSDKNYLTHIGITLYETLLGFAVATVLGTAVAVLLWWSTRVRKTLEPYLVVLNALPKIALGPIIIVWFGTGQKSIIFMTVLVTIVVSTITMESGFLSVDENKILLLRSLGAKKGQIFTKLIAPASVPAMISMLKINVGMSWIGSIMGEYLASRAGLGYLIVYGGQVFKLDLVMAATVTLCALAGVMYFFVSLLEKLCARWAEN